MLNVTNYYDIEQMVIPSLTKLNVMWSNDMIELMGLMVLGVCICLIFIAGGLISDYLDKRGF